jgi:eukaryotic-like serine/threonine-protein kinase
MRLSPGTRLGPYEVLATIGSGGMSEVYRARDSRLHREVAIKVVGEALTGDPGFLSRLEQEARLAGSLNHPNIVAVHDIGVHDGAPYVVTELLQGETLRERLARGPVPLSQALDWAGQMAQALAAAHSHGIIHRDLKPENVFLTRLGQVKLLDFGIAKATPRVTEPRGLLDPTMSPAGSATRTGAVLGTPGYMSPEQVRGEHVDSRSDIFSLGIILHELLSGQRAFRAGSIVESGYAILHDEPPPLPPSVPPGVAQLVQHCLAKDPEARFQSARDVALSLEVLRGTGATTPSTPLPPQGRTGRRLWRFAWPALGLLLLLVAFAAGRSHRQIVRHPAIQQLTFHRGAVWAARFAPDGRTVHLSAARNGVLPESFTTTLDSRIVRGMGLGETQLLSVSPKGELAILRKLQTAPFVLQGTLATVPQLGGTPRELATDVFGADWAPDGLNLAVVRTGPEGSTIEFPLGRVLFRSTGFVSDPRVSPAGDLVAFIDHPRSGDSAGRVTVVDRAGKTEIWSPLYDDAFGLAWIPGTEEVLVTGALPSDLDAIWATRRGSPPRLVYRGSGNLLVSDVNREGKALVIQRDWRQELVVAPRAGIARSVEWLDWASVSGISDDGKQVLSFESGVGASPNLLIVLQSVDQPAPTLLGVGRALDLSGDGRWALALDSAGSADGLRLMPTGPGEPRPLTSTGLSRVYAGSLFRDAKRVALLGIHGNEGNRLFVHEMESGQSRAISPELGPTFHIAVSPDQRWVASNEADGSMVLFPVAGGKPDRVTELGHDHYLIGWLDDGTLLAFERSTLPAPVHQYDPRTRKISRFGTLSPPDLTGAQRVIKAVVTPDGKTFAFHYRYRSDVLFAMDLDLKQP